MPFVPLFDTDMTDAPNSSDPAALTINPFSIPLRVNGHADITFTSPYDPLRSGQGSPVGDRTAAAPWVTKGFTNDDGLAGDMKASRRGKGKARHIALPVSSLKTGLCYDVRMMNHEQIFEDEHPEQPNRIYDIYKALVEAKLLVDPKLSGVSEEPGLMMRIGAREVTHEEVLLAHSEEHWDYLASTAGT